MFLLEAMASGVPVVQPRRGAFVEIIEKTRGGILVEPDDTESLAEGLFSLWTDRQKTEALGQRAFTNVREHYSVRNAASRLLEVYDDVLMGGAESSTAATAAGSDRVPAGGS
jgi:glycosyltransferase involved in cell wall biosynthesis